jgi:hypothetical protein
MDAEGEWRLGKTGAPVVVTCSRSVFLLVFKRELAAFRGGSEGACVAKGDPAGELSFGLPPVIMIFPAEAVLFSQPGLDATGGGMVFSFFRDVPVPFASGSVTSSFGAGLFSLGMRAPAIKLLIDDLRRCSGRGDDDGERECRPLGEALPDPGLRPSDPYDELRDGCSEGEFLRAIEPPLSS